MGYQIHLITERTALLLSVGIPGASVHDSQALIPLVKGIPPDRSRRGTRRRGPVKLHADKGYDYRHLGNGCHGAASSTALLARCVETSLGLGRHRWTIERIMVRLAGCRRLHRRY